MNARPIYALQIPGRLALELTEAAPQSMQILARRLAPREGPRTQRSLRPGAETPLWNAVRAAIAAELTRYGDAARLARFLGLSRQRLHELIRAGAGVPDGERMLLLLVWLQMRAERRTYEPVAVNRRPRAAPASPVQQSATNFRVSADGKKSIAGTVGLTAAVAEAAP